MYSHQSDDDDALQGGWMNLETSVGFDDDGVILKQKLGNQGIESPFQDGSQLLSNAVEVVHK